MAGHFINSPKLRPNPRSAPAMRAGSTLYFSGQIGFDSSLVLVGPDDAERQSAQCFENIGHLLDAAGAGFDDIVKIVVYLLSLDDYAGYSRAKAKFFTGVQPASTIVVVAALLVPQARVEIDVTAVND